MRPICFAILALLWPTSARAQRLGDVPLQGTTTEADVRTAWGEPAARIGQWTRYPLASGGELHLMFSPLTPHRLVYADLYGAVPGRRGSRRLFWTDERIAARAVEQIDPCATEEGAVALIWGWPDNEIYETNRFYYMADGTQVRLGPPIARHGIEVVADIDGPVLRHFEPRHCPRRSRAAPISRNRDFPRDQSVDPFAPPRLLSDITLSPVTTIQDIEAAWGDSDPYHGGYRLASGEWLWMRFSTEAPFALFHADLYPSSQARYRRRLFFNNPRAASRSFEQIDPCSEIGDIYNRWGPPDGSAGSGFVHEFYDMANGDEVEFAGGLYVRIDHPDGAYRVISCTFSRRHRPN